MQKFVDELSQADPAADAEQHVDEERMTLIRTQGFQAALDSMFEEGRRQGQHERESNACFLRI